MLKVICTLIKREYWENYQLLYRLPLWVAVVLSVLILGMSALSYSHYIIFIVICLVKCTSPYIIQKCI